MNNFRAILFFIMSFCAGGMTFANLTILIPGAGIGYEASWFKVAAFIVLSIVFTAIGNALYEPKRLTHEDLRRAGL